MTSQRSMNKNTVPFGKMLIQALRRGNWMLTLSVLASFLAGPVCFLFVLQSYESRLNDANYASYQMERLMTWSANQELGNGLASYFAGWHAWLQLIVALNGAVIVAVFGFRYLYHRRRADLVGSMPVTRGRQFFVQWLAGFLIWFVPFVIGNAFVLIIAGLRVGKFFGLLVFPLLRTCGLLVLCFLIVYNACLVAVQLSGNAVNALFNSALYGILAFTVYGISFLYFNKYFDTYCYEGVDFKVQLFAGLSPLVAPFALLELVPDGKVSEYLTLLLSSIALMAVNLGLAKKLGDLRPSELAEHGLECKPVRALLRDIVSVGTGLLLALFFSALTTEDPTQGWTMFGCVFGSVLAFAVLNVAYHASFRELFAHKLQLVLCVVLTGVIILCFRFDLFGYDSYVASESQITGLAIGSYGLRDDGYRYVWDEEKQHYTYEYDDSPAARVSTDASEIYQTLVTLTETTADPDDYGRWNLNVRVYTKTGSYTRTYRVYAEDAEQLAPLLETDSFRDTYYPASMGGLKEPNDITVYSEEDYDYNYDYVIEDDRDRINQLYAAYQEDFREHYSAELILSDTSPVVSIDFNYGGGYSPNLEVYPCFTRCLNLLEEWYPEIHAGTES